MSTPMTPYCVQDGSTNLNLRSLAKRAEDAAKRCFSKRGVQADCRVQPVRRGAEMAAVVLLSGSVVGPFLRAVFERFGGDAYAALRRWVQGLFGRDDGSRAPSTVVFENTATGAEFVFTPGLPEDAFRQAVALDPGPEPGRWVWDDA